MICTIDQATPIFSLEFLKTIVSISYPEVMLAVLKQVDQFIPDCIEIVSNSADINAAQDNITILQKKCLSIINTTKVTINGRPRTVNLSVDYGKANELFTSVAHQIISSSH